MDIKSVRKSGRDAWSERTQEDVVEGGFEDLCRSWGNNVPYHRIRYFKDDGLLAWCVPQPHSQPVAYAEGSLLCVGGTEGDVSAYWGCFTQRGGQAA